MKKAIRYIGSKEKLLPFLDETMFKNYHNKNIRFLDGFSGTTVVSKYCQENFDWTLYLSDISKYSKVLASRLFIENCSSDIVNHLDSIQHIKGIEGDFFNEFSIGGKPVTFTTESTERRFFTNEVGQKIDAIRLYIKNLYNKGEINIYEKDLMLHILISFADKNANTTSVYGAFLKNQDRNTLFINNNYFELLKLEKQQNKPAPAAFYNSDILATLNTIPEMDVIYLDPPYSTRRYETNYHILNYLADLDFSISDIKVDSKTALPNHIQANPFSSKKLTRKVFNDMITQAMNKTPLLFISYSTDGEMSIEEIQSICSENNYSLEIFDKEYRKYSSSTLSKKTTPLKEIILKVSRI